MALVGTEGHFLALSTPTAKKVYNLRERERDKGKSSDLHLAMEKNTRDLYVTIFDTL